MVVVVLVMVVGYGRYLDMEGGSWCPGDLVGCDGFVVVIEIWVVWGGGWWLLALDGRVLEWEVALDFWIVGYCLDGNL